jgi:hypothetical protein
VTATVIVGGILVMHLAWALLLVVDPASAGAGITLAAILAIFPPAGAVAALGVASIAAVYSLRRDGGGLISLVLLLPQQMLLALPVIGVGIAVWSGAYADGTVPAAPHPSVHILADQLAWIVVAGLHTWAIVVRASR